MRIILLKRVCAYGVSVQARNGLPEALAWQSSICPVCRSVRRRRPNAGAGTLTNSGVQDDIRSVFDYGQITVHEREDLREVLTTIRWTAGRSGLSRTSARTSTSCQRRPMPSPARPGTGIMG